jgi:hypothetical protein
VKQRLVDIPIDEFHFAHLGPGKKPRPRKFGVSVADVAMTTD